jgi:hypothetical protein
MQRVGRNGWLVKALTNAATRSSHECGSGSATGRMLGDGATQEGSHRETRARRVEESHARVSSRFHVSVSTPATPTRSEAARRR